MIVIYYLLTLICLNKVLVLSSNELISEPHKVWFSSGAIKQALILAEKGLDILSEYRLKILIQTLYYSVFDMIRDMYPDLTVNDLPLRA